MPDGAVHKHPSLTGYLQLYPAESCHCSGQSEAITGWYPVETCHGATVSPHRLLHTFCSVFRWQPLKMLSALSVTMTAHIWWALGCRQGLWSELKWRPWLAEQQRWQIDTKHVCFIILIATPISKSHGLLWWLISVNCTELLLGASRTQPTVIFSEANFFQHLVGG